MGFSFPYLQCIFQLINMIEQSRTIKVERIKKVAGGARLFINTLEFPLLFPLAKIEREHLREGMELTPDRLEQFKLESELFECDSKAAGLLSQRDYSIGEFKRKLKFKNFGEKSIREIVHKYKTKGLLDDKRYAAKIVNRLLQEKPSGKPFLIAALRRKLIPRELAEETVQSIYQDESDVALAVAALTKRWRQFGQFEVEEARTKSYNYLSRRGFNYSAAKAAFEKLWQKKIDGGEEEEKFY